MIYDKASDEMPTKASSSNSTNESTLLEHSLQASPDYSTARDLLGNIIAYYSDRIEQEESREGADSASLEGYQTRQSDYLLRRAKLHTLDDEAISRAVEEYRSFIRTLPL